MNSSLDRKEPKKVEDLDDYQTAAAWLMRKALLTGDGWMLRAIKTLMDRVAR